METEPLIFREAMEDHLFDCFYRTNPSVGISTTGNYMKMVFCKHLFFFSTYLVALYCHIFLSFVSIFYILQAIETTHWRQNYLLLPMMPILCEIC